VDAKVLDRLLAQTDAARLLTGERVVLSALFVDLRNSTEWAEHTEPEELVSSLNIFLGKITDVIFKYGGTLDKFVGDQVIGLFGTPLPMTDHAYRAAQAALDMQAVHAELQHTLQAQGRAIPPIGIGICSGEVIAGEFGPPIRTDFTAIGRVMNLSSRLCDAAQPGQILISHSTLSLLPPGATTEQQPPLELKGIRQPQVIYALFNLTSQ
jgi:adenylate cyclase